MSGSDVPVFQSLITVNTAIKKWEDGKKLKLSSDTKITLKKFFLKDKNSVKARVQHVVEQAYNTVPLFWHFKPEVCYVYHDPMSCWRS